MNVKNVIVNIAAAAVSALVVVPTAIAVGVAITTDPVAAGIYNTVQKVQFNKIKKGLKDGSIVNNNGRHHEVKATSEY